jgi:hypothetical protein
MIKWYHWLLFAVVVVVSLAMSWYSMMDLATNSFSLPWLLSASVSVIFDVGAVFLGLMSIEYAKTQDSGAWAELGTYAFALTSVYINVQHAILNMYGLVGEVMFGAAPVIAAVMLKVMLSFLTRQQRRASGRLVDRLPSVGILTWLRYGGQTWNLMSVAMRKRLVDAADKLDIPEDRHSIFVGQAQVQEDIIDIPQISMTKTEVDTPELVQDKINSPVLMPRTAQDIDDIVYEGVVMSIPDWLPRERTMSLAKIAEICVENGMTDIGTILSWAKDIKHSDIQYGTMYKSVQRAKQKVQT